MGLPGAVFLVLSVYRVLSTIYKQNLYQICDLQVFSVNLTLFILSISFRVEVSMLTKSNLPTDFVLLIISKKSLSQGYKDFSVCSCVNFIVLHFSIIQ